MSLEVSFEFSKPQCQPCSPPSLSPPLSPSLHPSPPFPPSLLPLDYDIALCYFSISMPVCLLPFSPPCLSWTNPLTLLGLHSSRTLRQGEEAEREAVVFGHRDDGKEPEGRGQVPWQPGAQKRTQVSCSVSGAGLCHSGLQGEACLC